MTSLEDASDIADAADAADTAVDDGSPPASKRQRMLSKACETCKSKKSRCDSARPKCDTCRRKGVACVYREKGQPGLRPGYGKAIENRLSLLESGMDKINQSIGDILHHVRSGPAPAPNPPMETPESSAARIPPDDAPPWQTSQQLSDILSPMIEPLPPPRSIPRMNVMDSALPPEDILQELVDLFFEFVYPWAPLFNKTEFMAGIYLPDRQILLHGIVVVSFRFWRKPDPPANMRDSYLKTSREQVLLKTVDVYSLISTQALALLALDALGQGPGPRTLNIMTMLTMAAKQLGLSKSSSAVNIETRTPLVRNESLDDGPNLSTVEAEEKHRLFWVIYALDRFSSVSHGHSGAIDTNSIRLPYPANDENWDRPSATEWFQPTPLVRSSQIHSPTNLWHRFIDALAFLDRSNEFLIQPILLSLPAHCHEWQSNFRRLDINIATYLENLPSQIREPPRTFDPMWTLLHATFHLINIRMYTVAAFPSTTSPYLRPSLSARTRCRQSIREVASLAASLQPFELDQLGPMFAFVVWVAARSLIILWTTGYENTFGSMPNDLEPLLNSLRQQAVRWPNAQRYDDLIELILDTKNSPNGPMGLEIFNDTRQTSYGLQNRLGKLAGHRIMKAIPQSFDFLDLPDLDARDFVVPGTGVFGQQDDGEWL